MAFLSVIIPAYNAEKTIKRCVESVLNQSEEVDFEIIIVNDGSIDNTKKILESLSSKSDKIKLIHQENKGLSAARNSGIRESNSKYLAFLDSDDEFKSGILYEFWSKYLDYEMDLFIFKYDRILKNDSINTKGMDLVTRNPEEAMKISLTYQGYDLLAWNKIWKNSLLINNEFPVGKLYEDMVTSAIGILKSKKIVFRDFSGYNYYENSESITSQNFKENHFDLITENLRLISIVSENFPDLLDYFSNRLLKAMINIAMKTTNTNDKKIINKYHKILIELMEKYDFLYDNKNILDKQFYYAWKLYEFSPNLFKYIYKFYYLIKTKFGYGRAIL
ncbi:glycosyltransferase family 2 protein [Aerococcus viridans]|uniref:glycosyltransferase family 2 protein n=1 Tax=Aerococcus viridans TaxID=1377 RepID=UPI0003158E54|nr:glycosyltransferase family 2 protein [Aerococcus viridans]